MILYGRDSKDRNYDLVNFPRLMSLHEFCRQVNPKLQFERIYVDNLQIQKIEDKKIERKDVLKRMAIYT